MNLYEITATVETKNEGTLPAWYCFEASDPDWAEGNAVARAMAEFNVKSDCIEITAVKELGTAAWMMWHDMPMIPGVAEVMG